MTPLTDLKHLKMVVEAALLTTQEPLSVHQLKHLFTETLTTGLLYEILDEIQADWAGRGIELVKLASGWRFRARVEFQTYRQPVTRGDIEAIRGVSVSSSVVQTLLERGWIEVIGHKEVPGRPGLYATSRKFLDDLGLSSLKDLPPLADVGTLIVPEAPSDTPTEENHA